MYIHNHCTRSYKSQLQPSGGSFVSVMSKSDCNYFAPVVRAFVPFDIAKVGTKKHRRKHFPVGVEF